MCLFLPINNTIGRHARRSLFALPLSLSASFPPRVFFFSSSLFFQSISMASTKKVTLKSSDGETFDVDEAVALESQTIKHMIEDDCADNGIPLPNVTSKILSKVIEYCKKHVESQKAAGEDKKAAGEDKTKTVEEELKTWDADFVKVDQATLFDLILVWIPSQTKRGFILIN